jgi:hypothetical protein
VRVCGVRRRAYAVAGKPEPDGVGDSPTHQDRPFERAADRRAERGGAEVGQRHAVEQHAPGIGVAQPGGECGEDRLAGAGTADDRDRRATGEDQVDAVEKDGAVVADRGHSAEFERPRPLRQRPVSVGNGGHVEHLGGATHAGPGPGEAAEHPGQGAESRPDGGVPAGGE